MLMTFLFCFHHTARETIVGFYSTGPKIKESDIKIDALMRRFCPNPVFVLIDVRPDQEGIPTTAYVSAEEVESVSAIVAAVPDVFPLSPALPVK